MNPFDLAVRPAHTMVLSRLRVPPEVVRRRAEGFLFKRVGDQHPLQVLSGQVPLVESVAMNTIRRVDCPPNPDLVYDLSLLGSKEQVGIEHFRDRDGIVAFRDDLDRLPVPTVDEPDASTLRAGIQGYDPTTQRKSRDYFDFRQLMVTGFRGVSSFGSAV